jgi:nitroimidazol reductase NimA-like FMN-containing flavoprotein (pyridoxamine 5'-phosphate oxidase superfamily)
MKSKGLEVLTEADSLELLRTRTLGRIGLHHGNEDVILPVFYSVIEHDIVFRTAPGSKLDAAVLGTRVLFQVDNASPGWSVLVRGHAHEIRDSKTCAAARTLLGHDWPAGERERYVRIAIEQITGRRLPQPA